jgi:ABC-type lipoprotein release transport system permease subunit
VNYCISILRMHIEKNRANLGTLKAFGFSNKGILRLYASVTSALLGSAFLVAYLFTTVLGDLLLSSILDLMDLTSNTEGLTFSNIPLYYSLPLFVIVPVLLILLKVKGILQLTPGALVFQRENQ